MQTYAILRRGGWQDGAELGAAAERSRVEGERMPDDVAWIRSYVLEETDGRVGTVCIYQASSPEAIRRHANEAVLPVDEIVKVVDTVRVRPDPVSARS
jgi:Protein of unknown function (DUF4242)